MPDVIIFLIVNTLVSLVAFLGYFVADNMSMDTGWPFLLCLWLFFGLFTLAWRLIRRGQISRKKRILGGIYTGPKPLKIRTKPARKRRHSKPRFTMD